VHNLNKNWRIGSVLRGGCAFLLLCLIGCAGLWDEVTSRDFHVRNLFVQPDPFVVLRESTDGDHRAKALRALGERKYAEGNMDAVLQQLTQSATTERQPLCRLAAIQTLGLFHDPRAVQALTAAFENAGTFPQETANILRCQALASLGQTGHADAGAMLVRVVSQPATRASEQDKQQTLDERIAAARALENIRHPQAAEALVRVLRSEKDVALRNRAHESLESLTGKSLPPDAPEWETVLTQPNSGVIQAADRGLGDEVIRRLKHFDLF
jgi:HEAT repeat protein